jgi:hypothetical protein
MEMSCLFHALVALAAEKEPPALLYTGLGGPQSQPGRCEGEKILLPLPGIESRFLGRQAYSPSLYRLRYLSSLFLLQVLEFQRP